MILPIQFDKLLDGVKNLVLTEIDASCILDSRCSAARGLVSSPGFRCLPYPYLRDPLPGAERDCESPMCLGRDVTMPPRLRRFAP